jgi:hypothetical protein
MEDSPLPATRSSGARGGAPVRVSEIEVTDTFFCEYRLRDGKIIRIKFHVVSRCPGGAITVLAIDL